ncbi:cation:proton antiporter [Lysinibacter cavernae]|uniref:CPA1 family monovalent cation:H+ antiporter n=1 Tax=Lysinibacter cavernae TaxID=1640652 RepID=A0A7X5R2S7_9MICO|nr:sodium:proton antiporter [Lysinibacter cavernae]NIH54615.1 CPA1 family monovalent cation:H+ antiporter [Lysinibacter cavernae]
MEPTLFILLAVSLMVAAAVFSRRTGVATPLILLVVGIGISFIPSMPTIEVDPEWILAGVLPPLLYSAAVNVPVLDLRRNFKAITGLSVTLVVISAIVVGFVLHWIMPEINLAAAIALGAVISPTDAVAATSIGKRLGLPGRLVNMLEGESLVNDATALVLLRSAVAATAGAVSLWGVAVDFVYAAIAAILIGLLIGHVTVFIRSRLNDPVLTTTVSFMVPFLAFLPAEHFGASGVLSVVVAGLVTGHRGAKVLAASERISEHTNWSTVQFVLEHGVFLLMGLELHGLILELDHGKGELGNALLIGLLLAVLITVLRGLFVIPQMALLRRDEERRLQQSDQLDQFQARLETFEPKSKRMEKRKTNAQRGIAQRTADLAFIEKEGLTKRGSIIISWAGMRGVVTLAAAQSLPAETPYRAFLIVVAFTVAVITLVGLGGSLPWVIRKTKIKGDDMDEHRIELMNLLAQANEAALAVLDDPEQLVIDGVPVDPANIERLRKQYQKRSFNPDAVVDQKRMDAREQSMLLQRRMLQAARDALLDARAIGSYSSHAINQAQGVFDMDEYRLDTMSKPD